MDDLAVDSDEEVDYSKMDQVTTQPIMHLVTEAKPIGRQQMYSVRRTVCCYSYVPTNVFVHSPDFRSSFTWYYQRRFAAFHVYESLFLLSLIPCFLSLPQGNKKGPLGRWDFDTQEEYSDYMNNKEALPKYVLHAPQRC